MKKVVKRVEIYIAKDGKEFLNMTDCIFYESHEMTSIMRKQWIEKYYNDFMQNCVYFEGAVKKNGHYSGYIHEKWGDTTIYGDMLMRQGDGRTIIINTRTGHCGKAICSNPKYFEVATGWAVAWARYKGEEIPDYI